MMKKNITFLLVAMVFLSLAGFVFADTIVTLPNPLCPRGAGSPNCIDSIPRLIAQIAIFLSTIVGALAVLMFMWAGICFLLSGMMPSYLEKGKHSLWYAIIGTAIALAATGLVLVVNAVIGNPPSAFLPSVASAAVLIPGIPGQTGDFNLVINGVLNFIWPIFIGFAVIMFIIAGFYFLNSQGEEKKVTEARSFLVWGVVGVAVAVFAFTIPYFIQTTITTGGGQCKASGAPCGSTAGYNIGISGNDECCSNLCVYNQATPNQRICY